MKLRVVITTYNRPTMCEELVVQIRSQYAGADIHVYNDGGVPPNLYDAKLHNKHHRGRRGYHYLWREIFQHLKRNQGWRYVLFLPDDATLIDGAISEMIRLYAAIDDENKVGLVPLVDQRGRGPQWVPFDPVRAGDVWLVKWFDCCALVDYAFFDALSWHVAEVPQAHFDNNESSGVGSQISKRLNSKGKAMYQSHESLVLHGDHESKMHPIHRKEVPL